MPVAVFSRELRRFIIVGGVTTLVDFLTYRCLLWAGGAGIYIAKGAGFLVGSSFSYFANRFITFGDRIYRHGGFARFWLLCVVTLTANVMVNAVVWKCLKEGQAAMEVAFVFATGVSASLNFLGMRNFVFKGSGPKERE